MTAQATVSHRLGTEFENQCSNNHPGCSGSEVMAYGQTISHLQTVRARFAGLKCSLGEKHMV